MSDVSNGGDVSSTPSVLSPNQWLWLMQRHTPLFDAFADLTSEIAGLTEEDRPNRLFFPAYAPVNRQTLTLAFHMSLTG